MSGPMETDNSTKVGRKPALSIEDAKDLRWLYYRGVAPNGKRYSCGMLGKMYGVNAMTALRVVDRVGPYAGLPDIIGDEEPE